MKPEELGCFEQVANVIGADAARYELQLVIDYINRHGPDALWNKNGDLQTSFDWQVSPQANDFWYYISLNRFPEGYSNKFLDEKSDIERLSQLCKDTNMSVSITTSGYIIVDHDFNRNLNTNNMRTVWTVLKKKKEFVDEMKKWEWVDNESRST
jgi:hypothetical protein